MDPSRRDLFKLTVAFLSAPSALLATLTEKPKASDLVSAQRVLHYVRKLITDCFDLFCGQPNDGTTWASFEKLAQERLGLFVPKVLRAVQVKCDREINTPDLVEQNQMRCFVTLSFAFGGFQEAVVLSFTYGPGEFHPQVTSEEVATL